MAQFWKMEARDGFTAACMLKKIFPELQKLAADNISHKLRENGILILEEDKYKTPKLMRLTLPFAIIVLIVSFVLLPIIFMVTGSWRIKSVWLENWFRALRF